MTLMENNISSEYAVRYLSLVMKERRRINRQPVSVGIKKCEPSGCKMKRPKFFAFVTQKEMSNA